MIVLTVNEYAELAEKSGAYDFLVIESDKIAVTQRRRASLYFSVFIGLERIVMMDDNIKTFYLEGSISYHSQDAAALFEVLLVAQQKTEEPMVSVSTRKYNNPSLILRPGQLGSKVFMMDLKKINEKLYQTSDWSALLPESPAAWGEDYFLQIMMHQLFSHTPYQGYHPCSFNLTEVIKIKMHASE